MDGCSKDELTAKNLVWNKSSSYSREKLEKPVGGGGGEWHPLGHWRVNKIFPIYYGDREFTSKDFSTLSVLKRNFLSDDHDHEVILFK